MSGNSVADSLKRGDRIRSIACPYLTGTVLAVAPHSALINWDNYQSRTDGCRWEYDDIEVLS